MFDDYYSFHPLLRLKQSICVVGFFGTLWRSLFGLCKRYPVCQYKTSNVCLNTSWVRLEHYLGHHKDQFRHRTGCYGICSGRATVHHRIASSSLRSRKVRDVLNRLDGVVFMQPLPVLLEQLDLIHQDNRRERF